MNEGENFLNIMVGRRKSILFQSGKKRKKDAQLCTHSFGKISSPGYLTQGQMSSGIQNRFAFVSLRTGGRGGWQTPREEAQCRAIES